MQDELFPKVENEFRIDSTNRTLFGWSLGGIFVLYTLFNYPELFAKYLVSGPPLVDSDFNVYQMEGIYAQKSKDLPKRLYIGAGDLDPSCASFPKRFAQTLEKRAYQELQFKWEIIPNKRHEYKAAANLLANGLDYLYGNMSIETTLRKVINRQGIAVAITEHHRLKKDHAEDYNISEGEIDWIGEGLLAENKITEAVEIFNLNATEYPNSWKAYDRLGKAYLKNGDNELAINNLKKSLELNTENTDAVEILQELQS